MDLVQNDAINDYHPQIKISAVTGMNMDNLMALIDQTLYHKMHHVTMIIPYDQGQVYGILRENAHIKQTDYQPDGIHVDVEVSDYYLNKYQLLVQ
jgi:GTP-binding protein HflX